MSCRCNEIQACKSDIALLENTIDSKLNDAMRMTDTASGVRIDLLSYLEEAIKLQRNSGVDLVIREILTQSPKEINGVKSKCAIELNKQKRNLKIYETEDKAFHIDMRNKNGKV